MRQVFEAFRLAYNQGWSQRKIAQALGLSQSTNGTVTFEFNPAFAATGWDTCWRRMASSASR